MSGWQKKPKKNRRLIQSWQKKKIRYKKKPLQTMDEMALNAFSRLALNYFCSVFDFPATSLSSMWETARYRMKYCLRGLLTLNAPIKNGSR